MMCVTNKPFQLVKIKTLTAQAQFLNCLIQVIILSGTTVIRLLLCLFCGCTKLVSVTKSDSTHKHFSISTCCPQKNGSTSPEEVLTLSALGSAWQHERSQTTSL